MRALVLINPNNPLGDIYPAQLLKECLEFAHRFEPWHYLFGIQFSIMQYSDEEKLPLLPLVLCSCSEEVACMDLSLASV